MTGPDLLYAAVADALDIDVVGGQRLSGGDVAEAFRIDLADGQRVFAETHRHPPPLFFDTEARGLAWLGASGAVAVPEVLAVADHPVPFLALAWVDEAARARADEAAFGRALARLHSSEAECYGRTDARPTSSRQLPNDPCDSWAVFYGSRRLLPLARLAGNATALPHAAVRALERLATNLDRFGLTEGPSRLHGDLWAGNRLVDREGASWLIDPAAHGGHREFDLAMMRLFGGFGPQCFAAYEAESPLALGWEERVSLHQIAPLVVHAIKFGGGYVDAATAAITSYS